MEQSGNGARFALSLLLWTSRDAFDTVTGNISATIASMAQHKMYSGMNRRSIRASPNSTTAFCNRTDPARQ